MAQPVGYTNDTTPSGLTERVDNSRPLVNGQPPQFAKMSSPAGIKPGVTPFANQHPMNSSGSAVSNGPPIAHNFSTTGSLSSHSSRNASPTPPVRPIGVSQSMENLSPSTGIVNNSRGNPMGTPPPIPNQLPSTRVNSSFGMGSNHPIMRMGSVPTNLHQEAIDQHQQAQKTHIEPSKPLNPHQLSQHLPQNIPLQSISENNQNHSEHSRISTSIDKSPLNSMQHSSLSSSSQTFQVHTHPLAAAQPLFNGPGAADSPHTNSINPSSIHHPNSLPPLPRTSTSGTLPSATTSQQEHFPNGPSMNAPSNPKPINQVGQNLGNVSSDTNPTAGTAAASQQFSGPSLGSSRGTGQPPVSQYSATGAVLAATVASPGQISGPPMSQFGNMSSVSHAVSNPPFQFSAHSQSASGPNTNSNNRTISPSVPPAGTLGFNQLPNTQPPPHPSASGVKPPSVGHPAHTSGERPQPTNQYPGVPPTSISGSNMTSNNRTASPGIPQMGTPGFNQPSNTHQPPRPGMPPTSASGIRPPPVGHQANTTGASQPLVSQFPGMPSTSASGPNMMNNIRIGSPGMPQTTTPGFNQPSNIQQPSQSGMPPTSASGVRPPPVGHQGHTTVANQRRPNQYPGMPLTSAPGSRLPPLGHQSHTTSASQQPAGQYPGTSASGVQPLPGGNQTYTTGASQQPARHYAGMPPTSTSTVKPPPAGHLAHTANQQRPNMYPGMPPSSTGLNSAITQQMRYPGMPPSVTSGSSQPPPPSHPSQFPGASNQPALGQPVTSGMPPNSQYPGMPPMPSPIHSPVGMPPPSPSSNAGSGDPYHSSRRYPQQPGYSMQSQPAVDALSTQMSNMSVTQTGFNKLWGLDYYDLIQTRNILPPEKVEPPKIVLHQEYLDNVNCNSEIFRCTLTKIPESNSLLQKARLPLGILIHPFKDLNHLPVIQCSTIVRCRACRTYINPFVYFVDQKRWKCNLCFRVNELPEEFQYDPVSKTYGCPTRRPEIKSSTMEFIAPSEYMLRPPQPAVYLFLLDVSQLAIESGYLQLVCDILLDELDNLPGDGRTKIGFVTFDSTVHFYNLAEGLSQPHQMIVIDTDDIFLPSPDNLLVNLAEGRELIRDLLTQLPRRFQSSHDPYSVVGPALQAAFKLMYSVGGRVTVFQSCLPTKGPGALTAREDPSQRAGKEAPHLNPAIDFYKRLALDCSGQQVAVDLFVLNSQYCDLATISGVSRFSGGCIHHFPLFKASNTLQVENFERVFRRYLKRKIGFEAVMRIRCSRGLAIHTFHGNFFVRSTDLLSLPNVNPDAGFGMQVSIEESLSELQNVCFQAALLYTTSKGERRIRVHTLCLPVATTLPDILHSADQQCIVGLLAKMAVDRSLQTSLSDAREAFINVAIDVLSAYRVVQSSGAASGLLAPHNLRLLPLYILALLKYVAFRSGQSTRLDDRVFAMCQMKTLPLANLIQAIYPDMYPVYCLEEQLVALEDGSSLPQPPRLHLSAEKLDQRGAFLMDTGDHMMLYVGRNISVEYCTEVFGVPSFSQIPEEMYELPVLETTRSANLRNFINYLQSEKPFFATIQVIRDDGHFRTKFIERLIEDRTESAFSYYEFLQHLKTNVK